MGEDQQKKLLQSVALPLEWHVSEHIKSQYADNIVVQARKHDFIVSFFETQLPPFAGSPEETRAFLEQLGSIRAECVGRVTVAPEMMPEIILALQTAYNGYLLTKSTEDTEHE